MVFGPLWFLVVGIANLLEDRIINLEASLAELKITIV